MSVFHQLTPRELWSSFEEILKIPRPSGKEEKIRDFLIDFAKNNDLNYRVDHTGNLLIEKPASKGFELRPTVILQSHLDMVCEKNSDVEFDFLNDPIPAKIEEGWIKSGITTLGADDGIGIAAQMAVLADESLTHGPIECLFTVEEETGLTGAFGLEPGFMTGKILLNLDSEDEGEIFIGCAGGIDVTAWFDYTMEAIPEQVVARRLSLTGLKGGHSGDEIHKGHGNAIKEVIRFLWNYADELDMRISLLEGGNLRNAIPREAFAEFVLPESKASLLEELVRTSEANFKKEHPKTAPDAVFSIQSSPLPPFVLDEDTQSNLLNALYACPHGVLAWSQSLDNMVETSTNLAAIKFADDRIKITTSQRSMIDSGKKNMAAMVEAVFLLAGAETHRSGGYPGWAPNPGSPLVKTAERVYQDLFDEVPVIRAIHAGLECGLFLEKYPDLDMISFGPTIKGAHSPDERLDIETTGKFYTYLIEMLKVL